MTFQESHESEQGMCFADRRKNHRLPVRLDIVVRLRSDPGRPETIEEAYTLNVSSRDMYFESTLADRLQVGVIAEVEMELPVRGSTIFGERTLAARGRVVRLGAESAEEPNRRGVAIVFESLPAFRVAVD